MTEEAQNDRKSGNQEEIAENTEELGQVGSVLGAIFTV